MTLVYIRNTDNVFLKEVDIETGKKLFYKENEEETYEIMKTVYYFEDKYIIISTKHFEIYETSSNTLLFSIERENKISARFSFSSDFSKLAILWFSTENKEICVYNTVDFTVVNTFSLNFDDIIGKIVLNNDGSQILICSHFKVLLYDLLNNVELDIIKITNQCEGKDYFKRVKYNLTCQYTDICFKDGRFLILASENNNLRVINVDESVISQLKAPPGTVSCFFHPTKSQIVTVNKLTHLVFRDIFTGECIQTINIKGFNTMDGDKISFSNDGSYLCHSTNYMINVYKFICDEYRLIQYHYDDEFDEGGEPPHFLSVTVKL